MTVCDLHIRNVRVIDGSGAEPELIDVATCGDHICDLGPSLPCQALETWDAKGLTLAPGFIDVHTHDDIAIIRNRRQLRHFRFSGHLA
jgi:N-acyl-D-aspartate/D-glutamate deacylase